MSHRLLRPKHRESGFRVAEACRSSAMCLCQLSLKVRNAQGQIHMAPRSPHLKPPAISRESKWPEQKSLPGVGAGGVPKVMLMLLVTMMFDVELTTRLIISIMMLMMLMKVLDAKHATGSAAEVLCALPLTLSPALFPPASFSYCCSIA